MAGIAQTGMDSGILTGLLKKDGVLVSALDATRLRLVTHKDVSREQIYAAAAAIEQCVGKGH